MREGLYSGKYLEMIYKFGVEDGFNMIEKRVKEGNIVNASELFSYIELLGMPFFYYHLSFVKSKITLIVKDLIQLVQEVSEEQLRVIKREKLDQVFFYLEALLSRIYTLKGRNEIMMKVKMQIALSLLNSELLERRIQGIRIISELCKISRQIPRSNSLNNLLPAQKIVEEIFGKRSHIQLIQRSSELLAYLMSNSNLTETELNVIWDCCGRDEQFKVEVYKVITEVIEFLPGKVVGFIIEKYIRSKEYMDQDIVLLLELSKRLSSVQLSLRALAIEIIWKVILGKLGAPTKKIYDRAVEVFSLLIASPKLFNENIMGDYFAKILNMIETVFSYYY